MHPIAAPPVPVRIAPSAATRRLSALRAPLRPRRFPSVFRAQKPEGDINMFSGHSGSDTQAAHDAAKKAAAEAEKAAAKIREAAVPVRPGAAARRLILALWLFSQDSGAG